MKDSKNIVIGLLCTVLCVMAVAYAAFSTSLEINGTATISSTWNVAISDIQCTTEKGNAGGVEITEPSKTGIGETTATIGVSFNQPGDKMTCTVYVANNGTLEAKLASIVTTPAEIVNGNGQGELTINDFIHFKVGQGTGDAKQNDVLAAKAGETPGQHTYTIYAEYMNVVDANGNTAALPEGVNSRQISVQFNYVQNLAA